MQGYHQQLTGEILIDGLTINGVEPFIVYEALSRNDTWKSATSTQPDRESIQTHPVIAEGVKQLNMIANQNDPHFYQKIYELMLQIRQIQECEECPVLGISGTRKPPYYPCPHKKEDCAKKKKMVYLNQFSEFSLK